MDADSNSNEGKNAEEIHTTDKITALPRKVFWNPTAERETFRTVVVNYHFGNKRKNTGAVSKRRETWSQMISALNAKKERIAAESDASNTRGIYQVSKEELVSIKPENSSTVCCKNVVASDGSRQSIKVEFYDTPPLQKAESEEYKKSELLESEIACNRSSSLMIKEKNVSDICCIRKCDDESSTQSIKVEIFNLPPLQEAKAEDFISSEISGMASAEDGDIIVISDDDEEIVQAVHTNEYQKQKSESNAQTQPDLVKALQKLAEAAQTTCVLCSSVSKSTQKPEERMETTTQTPQPVKMEQKINQVPSTETSAKPPAIKAVSAFKQRQLELHRLRVQVEQKRLKLLDIKLQREKEEITRDRILFERELQMKSFGFKQLDDERDI